MNDRGGVVAFFLFLFLSIIILLQIFSMVQSDRLYERVNHLLETWQNGRPARLRGVAGEKASSTDLPGEEYAGDEGDWLVWRIGAEPATLNPITSKDFYVNWIALGNIFEQLLVCDYDEVKLKPWLTESYEVSDDGLEITFRLRDDIRFSDGKPITTDDVIFTYESIINPGVDAHDMASYWRAVKEVVQVDSHAVKFIFRHPYFKGVEIVGLMPILPKHIYEFSDPEQFNKRRSKPVGSGPYVFEKWDVGREIVLRRNENYWGHKPKLGKIVFRIITNEVAAVQALRSHKIDFMVPTCEQFAELSQNEEFVKEFECLSYWNPGVGYSYIGWNQSASGGAFFGDRRVRLAMTHLVNREMIIKYILGGLGRIVTGPFYVFSPQYDSSIEPWPYDPERARQLLDQAGWRDTNGDGIRDKEGVPFRFRFMTVSGYLPAEQLAKLLKDEMAKAGIDLIPDPYEWSVFEQRLNTRSFDAAILAWGTTVQQDPYRIWHSSQIKGRGSNYVGFNNPQADAIIEEARRTQDEQKRVALYHRFHRIVHEQQPYTFLWSRPSPRFLDKRFENVIVHQLGLNPRQWFVPREKQRYR